MRTCDLRLRIASGDPFAGEHPIARFDGAGNVEYLLQDSMGSVTGVVDAGANVTAEARWDAFGEPRSGNVSSAVAGGGFGLHGMWLDEGTGLYYVRARSYDARTGRFLSRDPVAGVTGRPETMNPYSFVNGNPVVYVDPSGAFSLGEISAVGAISGVLASIALPSFTSYLKTGRATRDASHVASGAPSGAAALQSIMSDLKTFRVGVGEPEIPQYYLDALAKGLASGTKLRRFFAEGDLSAGVDVHGSLVVPIPPGGAIGGLNRQWFASTMETHTYCYTDNGYTQFGFDAGFAAQSVWAWGKGPWLGDFKATALNLGPFFAGSLFWSPDWSEGGDGWVGFTLGFGKGPPGLAYEQTYYKNCDDLLQDL